MTASSGSIDRPSAQSGFGRDFAHLVDCLKRGWRLAAACVAVCLTLAVIYLAATQRLYQATARLLVLQQGSRP